MKIEMDFDEFMCLVSALSSKDENTPATKTDPALRQYMLERVRGAKRQPEEPAFLGKIEMAVPPGDLDDE